MQLQLLSENSIKQVMLRYLKQHYRQRLGGDGRTELRLDQRGEGGIVADGYISFKIDADTPFLATFEATSFQSREEVLYRMRTKILWWDALSFGLFVITILYVFLYFLTHLTVKTHGLFINIVVVLSGIGLLAVLYFLFFRKRRRYRYIYAIEQFKQYFADDQWIAIGENVFLGNETEARDELKRQCIYNGFGLVEVDFDERPHLIVAPARHDEIHNKRRQLTFVDRQTTIGQRTYQSVKSLWDRLYAFFQKNTETWGLQRFQRISYKRIVMMGLAASVLGLLFWRQLTDKDIEHIPQRDWEKATSTISGAKESSYYYAGKDNLRPFEERTTGYLDLLPEDSPRPDDPALEAIELFLASDSRLFTYYDCTRLYNFDAPKYIVQWQHFDEFETAKDEVVRLMQKGFRCNIVWHGCFEGQVSGYIVFLDLVFNTQKSASQRANFLQQWLAHENEPTEGMAILVVRGETG